MSKARSGIAFSFLTLVILPACTTKTEVVALQPEARHSVVRITEPAVRTRTVRVKQNTPPSPSPAAMEVVNAYDQ